MGGQEDERDAAVWSLQPLPDHTGVMITGVVDDDVDPPLAGVAGLQLREQRDGGGGIDPLGLNQRAVEILQVDAAWRLRRWRPDVPRNATLSPLRTQPCAGRDWYSGCTASAK